MTTGQRAVAVAMIYPETQQGKRATSFATKEVSGGMLSKARNVLRYAPDLADTVLTGAQSLDVAYQSARDRKQAAESEEAQLEALQKRSPELADNP